MDPTILADAARLLGAGGLVAFPTETVYGLGASATDAAAVRRVFAVKGRPADHPVIVHVEGPDDLDRWASSVPAAARALAEAFWPGPLTVVVPRSPELPDVVSGGRPTVGLRSPAHPIAQDLLRAFGGPVAAPSANRFGRISATTAAAVKAELGGEVDLILDGGPCSVGVESTIIDCTGVDPVVLRVGGVTLESLVEVLDSAPVLSTRVGGAPGTLLSHYAPNAAVVLSPLHEVDAIVRGLVARGEKVGVMALRTAGARVPGATVFDVGDDSATYARVLYERLREADAKGLDVIVAVPPPPAGMGAAVADRLLRAATQPA